MAQPAWSLPLIPYRTRLFVTQPKPPDAIHDLIKASWITHRNFSQAFYPTQCGLFPATLAICTASFTAALMRVIQDGGSRVFDPSVTKRECTARTKVSFVDRSSFPTAAVTTRLRKSFFFALFRAAPFVVRMVHS